MGTPVLRSAAGISLRSRQRAIGPPAPGWDEAAGRAAMLGAELGALAAAHRRERPPSLYVGRDDTNGPTTQATSGGHDRAATSATRCTRP